MKLMEASYATLRAVRAPLLLLEEIAGARIGEAVRVVAPDGSEQAGEVLRIDSGTVLVQLFGETAGLDLPTTRVIFSDRVRRAPLAPGCVGRIFDGSFRPLDGLPPYLPERWAPVSGRPLNPTARARPEEFIETGYSAIDGLNTLVKGQKLPLFTCAGLPAREVVAGILSQAQLAGGGAFVVVFVALGLTHQEANFYRRVLDNMAGGFVAFLNLADQAVVERLLAPRFGLTVAEYLAFERGLDVLVLVTDMVNYCDALREVAAAREELPGRRGYPGYLYSDLASLYERAGRIRGRPGSVTLLPVVTMPEDDITHPIPDLTGYITEGQLVLSRDLHQRGIFPPLDVLPSLSRLMQHGIGAGRTRADHRAIANGLYRCYARGRELRRLEAIVGRDGMLAGDRRLLDFADRFEAAFIAQSERRSVAATLDAGAALLREFGEEGK
ncbi:MAG: V-type ATP synthase subunit B [Desulfuromonadales bacterium GWD2_61_12]|nr:MAG: V-type ATP synthase subunit B [Desulfuromonadales bacterium GWC2_61_20]OGR34800.1 MAG: V-type ATP synthase subunit B [Desulfuromonadales bacterium GWD2_61_12]